MVGGMAWSRLLCLLSRLMVLMPLPLDLLPGHGQAVTDGLLLPHQWQCNQRLVRAQPGAEARVPQHFGACVCLSFSTISEIIN